MPDYIISGNYRHDNINYNPMHLVSDATSQTEAEDKFRRYLRDEFEFGSGVRINITKVLEISYPLDSGDY